ncbi:MAG: enoyl-CoA hydratase/isomerase family protein, partial [Syntrophobacteraceae bacterium]
MEEKLVFEERRGQIAIVTLNRPEVMNSLNFPMLLSLKDCVEALHLDHGVRVVVITGAGEKAFCAGADLKERATFGEQQVRQYIHV